MILGFHIGTQFLGRKGDEDSCMNQELQKLMNAMTSKLYFKSKVAHLARIKPVNS